MAAARETQSLFGQWYDLRVDAKLWTALQQPRTFRVTDRKRTLSIPYHRAGWQAIALPVVEAMTCGAAVLLSAGPTMHEIGRDAALYVDPLSLAHIADTLKRALSDGALRAGSRARVGASGVAHA